jgi:NAD(P)-dependent dehydrogenase (short-subunit alcohol dehydrogenase family)
MEAPTIASLLDLRGQVALVTGAGRGLGRGIATRLAAAGARVVVHYRGHPDEAKEAVRDITRAGGEAVAKGADLTQETDVAELVSETTKVFGRLDLVVNNAGVYPMAPVVDMRVGDWDAVMADNLRSAFLCLQAGARQMIAQGHGGAIVNVTSIESVAPLPAHAHYGTSKAGLEALTRASAQELGLHGIRVNAVAPGLIWREGIEAAWPDGVERWKRASPLGRLGQPDDVADACLFLAGKASRWITGTTLVVDGGVLTRPPF